MTTTGVAILDQYAERLDLGWTEGDPFERSFTVEGGAADWPGTYTAQIRKRPLSSSPVLATITVGVVTAGADATVTLTLSDTSAIKRGVYYWSMKEDGDVTRLNGRVVVKP